MQINSFLGYYRGSFDGCLYTAQIKSLLGDTVLTFLIMKNNLCGVTGIPQQVLNPS